ADIQQHGNGILLNRTFFPNFTRFANDMLVLRSVQSWEAEHQRGQFYLTTAHPANPAFLAESPHIGAVVALEKGGQGKLPPFISLNGNAGRGSVFLGGKYEPMSAPANQGGFTTIQHNFFGNVQQSQTRFDQRYALLNELDARMRANPFDLSMAKHADFYGSARQLMYDPLITDVFRFSAEDNARYGNHNFGRACIVARNIVRADAGAVYVNINNNGWDTHQRMLDTAYSPNMYVLAGQLDQGVGMMIEDLKQSGHFDTTLIVMMGEFGRTPGPLNAQDGRDHHKDAMSVAMFGGGVRGGVAIGATDANGAQIIEPGWHMNRPIYPEDIVSTLYSALGINWTKGITDTPSGRRYEYIPLAWNGRFTAVREVFG
ncbi:MAG: DUF1501 domain-containing protein, partial [Bryobacteraceae bacterium]